MTFPQSAEKLDDLLNAFRPVEALSWNEAKEALMRAARFNEANANAVEKVLGLAQEADCFEAALWKEIGSVLNCSGQYFLSQRAYYNAYAISPDEMELKHALVYTFRQLKDHEKAIRLYSAKLVGDPDDLSAIEKLANSFFESRNFFEAAFFYQLYLAKRPGDPLKEKQLNEAQKSSVARNKKYENLITFFRGIIKLSNS
ncbi:MAG: hypothetical protein IPH35_04765 [Rhodoferax sp.]|nr:hypothetical protein [Rhodoferax sp.]